MYNYIQYKNQAKKQADSCNERIWYWMKQKTALNFYLNYQSYYYKKTHILNIYYFMCYFFSFFAKIL